jgi:hypothetical protein
MRVLREPLIYGETIEALKPGLRELGDAVVRHEDGMAELTATVRAETSTPFMRALLRAEAELLLEAADASDAFDRASQEPYERAADAFMRVIRALGAVAQAGEPGTGGVGSGD